MSSSLNRVLCAAVVLIGLLGQSIPAHADEEPSQGLQSFGACLANTAHANVLLVMDESGSLKQSDPQHARITAAHFLVDQLSQFAEATGADMSIRVTGFHNFFNPGADWRSLPSQARAVADELDTYKNRNEGRGTDYWLALDGARSLLIDQLKQQPDSCQLLVFVSDGGLDIDRSREELDEGKILVERPYAPDNALLTAADRSSAAKAATTSMCRVGGLMDQFAAQKVTLLGVGLLGENGGAQAQDFDLMKRLVTGTGDGGDCGSPSERSTGDFVLAKDIDDLLPFFHRLSDPNRTPVEQEVEVCQGAVCPEGSHSIVLDDSISKVSILASAPRPGMSAHLVRPDAGHQELRAATLGTRDALQLKGTAGTVQWLSPRSFEILLDREGTEGWVGQWQLIFVDPSSSSKGQKSRSQIAIIGDLRPTPLGDWRVRSGEAAELSLGLITAVDKAVDPDTILGTVETIVRYKDRPAEVLATWSTATDFATPIALDASELNPGRHVVSVDMTVTTAGTKDSAQRDIPGTKLEPQHLEFPLEVLPALGFPSVGEQVVFGTATGPASLEADLSITGDGCVWLEGASPQTLQASPDGVDMVTLSSSANSVDSCVRLDTGQQGVLPLLLSSEQTGTGGLAGSFQVHTAPLADLTKVQTVEVSYLANMIKPLNTQKFTVTLILALILGPGIPLLLLYALKFFLVSRIPHRSLVGASIPVRFDGSSVRRLDGRPLLYSDDWLVASATAGPARDASPLGRSVSVAGHNLRVHNGLSPLGTGSVRVEAAGHTGVSDTNLRPVGRARQAQLPLAVQGHWALLQPAGAPATEGVFLALFSYRSGAAERANVVADFQRKAADAFQALQDNSAPSADTRQVPPQSPDAPFGGSRPPSQPPNTGSRPGPFG